MALTNKKLMPGLETVFSRQPVSMPLSPPPLFVNCGIMVEKHPNS